MKLTPQKLVESGYRMVKIA